ncbi:MAG: aromatic ring-hydroxylating dioxygenase subunit alpha, partial [Actinomycetota bacterium]|nr:aromatic ring-hydroxylating dioxygenase subunit alpha [Actinomycetota bacterium]
MSQLLDRALELFWHPVCTLEELNAAAPKPVPVRLLGRALAIADLGDGAIAALSDRCLHRSTRLSIGWVEGASIRCAYHGWRWSAQGRCVEIPSMPDVPIPAKACIPAYQAEVAYGLVWVRLDGSAATTIPAHPAWEGGFKVVSGRPYSWPVGAARRVENFVDLAHFAWVHDKTLGRRDTPVPPMAVIRRESGELRFEYQPPEMTTDGYALYGFSRYRMPMPLSVDIAFHLDRGARRHLWMTASPLDDSTCRTFWSVARDDDLEGDDMAHLAFQDIVLAEDEPVVCNQDPPAIPLEDHIELSVRTDRVSVEYRRWLRELADAAAHSPLALRSALEAGDTAALPRELAAEVDALD